MHQFRYSLIFIFISGYFFGQSTPQQMINAMGRGINLGNVLQAPVEGNWSSPATEQYFIDVANAGFTNVRIGMDFFGNRTPETTTQYSPLNDGTSYSGSSSDYNINTSYLNRIQTVLDWALNQNLIVILDFHGADLKNEFLYTFDNQKIQYTHPNSARRMADLDKFYSIWSQIADRFKNYSDNLLFEVLNEPYFEVSDTEMNTINQQVIDIIRLSGGNNSSRKIIITGGTQNSFRAPTTIAPSILQNDSYLIATFHYYRPFSFTKSSSEGNADSNWGSIADKNTVADEFQSVVDWANGFSPPVAVYLGEFGADNSLGYSYETGNLRQISTNTTGFSDGGPDNSSRINYHQFISELAIANGFAFSVWDAGNESSKTLHLRNDDPANISYDFDYFTLNSYYDTSQNIPSTVMDQCIWVDDIKDAVLGLLKSSNCSQSSWISNADFECGIDQDWTVQTGGTAVARKRYGGCHSRTDYGSLKIIVDSPGNSFNEVILKNTSYSITTSDFEGKTASISIFAKALSGDFNASGQSFRIMVKRNNGGSGNFSASEEYDLTTSYPITPFSFTYDIPPATSSLEFQILCGRDKGTYVFDDIQVQLSPTLSTLEKSRPSIKLFPNPTNHFLFWESNEIQDFSLFSLEGKLLIFKEKPNDKIDVTHLSEGVYLTKISGTEKQVFFQKIIVKN